LKVLGEQRVLGTTWVTHDQCQNIILDTAHSLTTVGPTMIIIDALDESGAPDSKWVFSLSLVVVSELAI
jgi:hypothetical protein